MTQNDWWLDEGWTVYNTACNAFSVEPFSMAAPPVTLASANPFNRVTPAASYSQGRRFFAGLAAVPGLAQLRARFRARVRNRGAGYARSFVVTFNVKPWAGTQFVYATTSCRASRSRSASTSRREPAPWSRLVGPRP